jgi:hypothetical protein
MTRKIKWVLKKQWKCYQHFRVIYCLSKIIEKIRMKIQLVFALIVEFIGTGMI